MASVAIVGASNDRTKYGNRAVRAYLRRGWTVYPVNPDQTRIEGLPVFRTVMDLPARVDRIALYVPPQIGLTLLDAIAAHGAGELFVNPGAESEALLAKAEGLGLAPIQACAIADIGERP